MKKIFILFFIALGLSSYAQKDKKYPFQNSSLSTDTRVEDLLSRLTVEEKVSLMMNQSPAIDRLGIPAYDWWNEALHGVARAGRATVFPQPIGLAATFDDQAVFETFEMVSDEARAKYNNFQKNKEYERYEGLTFWTPNINIFRDPRWGRGMETYGEDPYLTSRMGVAVVKGLQGNDPEYFKTLACAKHFAVHSGPEWSRHSIDVSVSTRDLLETYLPSFEALVKEANVQQVMCAYNSLDGEPCCSSKKLLNVILRKKWGYKGITLSDCDAISDFWIRDPVVKRHETHANATEASVDAVRSGTDLECGRNYESLVKAIKSDKMSEEEINVSLRRVLTGRFKLGMFDPNDQVKWSKIPYSVVNCENHKEMALEMARKSIVLLKNKNQVLPLNKSIKKIAVVGPNANDSTMLWGNYNGFPSSTVTILDGIRNKVPGIEVIYEKGCDLIKGDVAEHFAATAEKVKDADVIIFVGGISPSLEGEEMPVDAPGFKKGDRTDIELPAVQLELLKVLKKTGKPIVFVLCTGSAIALNWENENLDAIVNGWYGGQAAGTAIADVIFGDYNPAGRLPVTFYRSVNQLSDFEDYSMKGRTYRYMTAEPLYPFGYGLSFSKFVYSDILLSKSAIDINSSVSLNVSVANKSKYDGDEVVQVYIKRVEDKEGPIRALRAFKRVPIKAMSKEKVVIELGKKAFMTFDESSKTMKVLPGKYLVMVGSSSGKQDLTTVPLTIK